MNRRTEGRSGKKLASAVLAAVAGGLWVNTAAASPEWEVFGNTHWVSGDSRLTLEMPSVQHPYLRVESSEAGDLQWIAMSVPFTFKETTIEAILLCFETPDEDTFISQIRLAEYSVPSPAFVKHDDGTDLFDDDEGDCYFSDVDSYTPEGAVNMSLRLNFAEGGDEIRLGGVAILVDDSSD